MESSCKEWKPSIKLPIHNWFLRVENEFKTKQNKPKTANDKRVRKPVPDQNEKQINRNPILYPTSEVAKKVQVMAFFMI